MNSASVCDDTIIVTDTVMLVSSIVASTVNSRVGKNLDFC